MTNDGLPHMFAINTLAPYVLTALIERPKRLVYLSSGMHDRASAHLDDTLWRKRRWDGSSAYAESKLHDVLLAFAVARLWPDVRSNALTPGWVATKMGGAGAPDDIAQAHLTQAWLATSDDPAARTSGGYFYHLKRREPNPETHDVALQDQVPRHLPGGFRGRVARGPERRGWNGGKWWFGQETSPSSRAKRSDPGVKGCPAVALDRHVASLLQRNDDSVSACARFRYGACRQKLSDISSLYKTMRVFLLAPREFAAHLAPGRLVFHPVLSRPVPPMDRRGILGNSPLRRA